MENSVRNTIIIQNFRDIAVHCVMFCDCKRMESRVFINFAVKLLVESCQGRGSGAS